MGDVVVFTFNPGDEPLKGTWRTPNEWQRSRRGEKALITCRQCGEETAIVTHTVASDGTVTPSLVCPIPDCTEHIMGRLEGWDPHVG